MKRAFFLIAALCLSLTACGTDAGTAQQPSDRETEPMTATVSTGTNTLTLTKSVSVTPVVSAGYVASGTAGNSAVSLTASIPTKAAATIIPGTSSQEIAAGTYLTGKQTVAGAPNLRSENIVAGVTIFQTEGSAQIPIVTQDAVSKVLSIS